MTLNEAIEHAENVAATCDISSCAEEHMQLVEWLKELRDLVQDRYRMVVGYAQENNDSTNPLPMPNL